MLAVRFYHLSRILGYVTMSVMVPEKLLDARTASYGIGHLLLHLSFDHREGYDQDAVWLFDAIPPEEE